jgi:hypothetical protein
MIDIPTEQLTVTRNEKGDWCEGRFERGKTKEFEIEASVQPLRGNEIKQLPEHRRTAEAVKIYTEFKLRTSDEKNQLPADRLLHDGKVFEVHSVMNWSIGTDIPHFKVVAVKEDGQGGGNEA